MTTLTRWDPFREMASMRNMMNRLFDEDLMPSRMFCVFSHETSASTEVSLFCSVLARLSSKILL